MKRARAARKVLLTLCREEDIDPRIAGAALLDLSAEMAVHKKIPRNAFVSAAKHSWLGHHQQIHGQDKARRSVLAVILTALGFKATEEE